MTIPYDAPTWDRLEHLLARAGGLSTGRRSAFLEEVAREEPHVAEELATLLALTSPSSRFFRALERTLFEHEDHEDTGAVLALYDPRVGATLASRYELEAVRGRGGMGTVYRARDRSSGGGRVAVKTLSRSLSRDRAARERFFRTAQAISGFRHPNVCPVLGTGECEDGTPFLVMPFLEGTTLGRRMREGPVPLEEAVDWLRQACHGLAAIHSAGLVHRDLSPRNLLRTPEGRVFILDFGLAKPANATLGTRSRELGTLPYMAPEQLTEERIDPRADVWALAAIFYEMVSGARPFPGSSIAEVQRAILDRQPRPLNELCPAVPHAFSRALSRALEKDPGNRLPSVADLLSAIDSGGRPAPT